jgi:hypothetical protein
LNFKLIFMKSILSIFALLFSLSINAQEKKSTGKFDEKKKSYEVLASCGTCNFKMKAPGCPLAIKLEDKYYFVEGTKIDDHGDAHAEDGFCNVIKKAKVQGTIKGDSFTTSYFEIIKEARTPESKN